MDHDGPISYSWTCWPVVRLVKVLPQSRKSWLIQSTTLRALMTLRWMRTLCFSRTVSILQCSDDGLLVIFLGTSLAIWDSWAWACRGQKEAGGTNLHRWQRIGNENRRHGNSGMNTHELTHIFPAIVIIVQCYASGGRQFWRILNG